MCVGKTFCVYHRANQLWKHPHVCEEDTCWRIRRTGAAETPPRAWGRPPADTFDDILVRNTPTYVGKTGTGNPALLKTWKHPHVRGEDECPEPLKSVVKETPPRAWGRPFARKSVTEEVRNTPTCVGKTSRGDFYVTVEQKHPHVRGEDNVYEPKLVKSTETPPRAWGRPAKDVHPSGAGGNTPTCVGKACQRRSIFCGHENPRPGRHRQSRSTYDCTSPGLCAHQQTGCTPPGAGSRHR